MRLRGTVYFWKDFPLKDGAKADKCLVLLNSPGDGELHLVVKTTSQDDGRQKTPGCGQHDWRQQWHYFVPSTPPCFQVDTWVQLHEVYPVDDWTACQHYEYLGCLSAAMIEGIITCLLAHHGQDLLDSERQMIESPRSPTPNDLVESVKTRRIR
jgi:hypothetical protein